MSSKDCKKSKDISSEDMTSEEFVESKFYNPGEHAPYKKSNTNDRFYDINNPIVSNLFGRLSRHTELISHPINIIKVNKNTSK
jgi:hypothetical protein